jgi:hypothetical protein
MQFEYLHSLLRVESVYYMVQIRYQYFLAL